MVDITHALERVARVPGALRRRALMVGRVDLATKPTMLPAAQRPLAAVACDTSLLVHDAMAAATAAVRDKTGGYSYGIGFVKEAVRHRAGYVRAKTASARAETLVDAFVTAAALRDVRLLRELFEMGLDAVAEELDYAALMHAAAVGGDCETVAWLWALTTNVDLRIIKMPALRRVEPIREALTAGARRALDVLDVQRDEGMIQHIRGLIALDATLLATIEEELATETMPVARGIAAKQSVMTALPTSPTTAAMLVLTVRSLMNVIGAFQDDPLGVVKPLISSIRIGVEVLPPHAAAAYAIIQGDLYTFKAACLLSKVRPPDLPLLLQFAACEGRLNMVQWLHSQFTRDTKCRPDTMGMAVRCGWAEIVEWLHLNCPESAQTMSSDAWNDAARWGHVDVLRVGHKYDTAESTPGVLTHAIGGGHLEIVQLLHSLRWGFDRNVAMREALLHGQLQIVRWLHTEQAVSSDRLVDALCSNAPGAQDAVQYVWSLIDPKSELVQSCVATNFRSICEKAASTTITTVLPLVAPDSDTAYEGLLAATQKARLDNVKLLLPHWSTRDAHRLDSLLQAAVATQNVDLSTWLVAHACFGLADLDRLFERLVHRQRAFLEAQVMKSVSSIEVDPFVCSLMKAIHKRRQQERKRGGISASSHDGARFEVERELLTSVSERTQPKLVNIFIASERPPQLGESESSALITDIDGLIQFERARGGVVNGVAAPEEPVLRYFGQNVNGALRSPFCAVHAARTGDLDVLRFLFRHDLLPSFIIKVVVAIAYANCQTSVLEWLGEQGAGIASERGLRAALDQDHMAIVGFAIDRHDAAIDQALHTVLLDTLCKEVERAESYARRSKSRGGGSWSMGWGMSLLQLVMQKRPDQHQRLLETAATSGFVPAIEFILGPRSGCDVTTMQLSGALVAGARGKNEVIMKMLYEKKLPTEQIEITELRKLAGFSDVDAVETLLSKLSEWNADVRLQLEEERASVRVFLPLVCLFDGSSGRLGGKPRHMRLRRQRLRPGKRVSRP